jgi:hypothetical protein
MSAATLPPLRNPERDHRRYAAVGTWHEICK